MLPALALLLLGLALAPSEQAAVEVPAGKMPVFSVMSRLEHRRLRFVPPPPPSSLTQVKAYVQEATFSQFVDHFDAKDLRTWKQRYFIRSDLYEDGGPAFIYIGGEGPESADSLGEGLFMVDLARTFKAKLFDLEHRFYGESQPFSDLATENLQYLSADQALADLAYFIEYQRQKGEIKEGQKVAVFGGSYPGNLAAWSRLKYPHLIHAAVSSSAPVHAKADFTEYMEVVASSLDRVAGKFCSENVKKATDRIVTLLMTTDGYKTVKDTFHVGTELKDKLDLDVFFETLSNPFAGAVQYNRDWAPYSAYNIKYICSYMEGDLTPDQAMVALAKLVLGDYYYYDYIKFDFSYKSTVAEYQKTEYYSAGDYVSMRQWLYQTCTEFGYYQTFGGAGVPFPKQYNDLDYAEQLCTDLFGKEYTKDVVTNAVERSNLVFGDLKPDLTNVLFVNGNVDPWHALGIQKDVSPAIPAILIDGASHCQDMYSPKKAYDTQSMKDAHQKIHDFVQGALYETPNADPGRV